MNKKQKLSTAIVVETTVTESRLPLPSEEDLVRMAFVSEEGPESEVWETLEKYKIERGEYFQRVSLRREYREDGTLLLEEIIAVLKPEFADLFRKNGVTYTEYGKSAEFIRIGECKKFHGNGQLAWIKKFKPDGEIVSVKSFRPDGSPIVF